LADSDGPETQSPGKAIEEKGEQGDEGDTEPEGEAHALDAVQVIQAREEEGLEQVAGDKKYIGKAEGNTEERKPAG
jgi:hypothetical protein